MVFGEETMAIIASISGDPEFIIFPPELIFKNACHTRSVLNIPIALLEKYIKGHQSFVQFKSFCALWFKNTRIVSTVTDCVVQWTCVHSKIKPK